MTVRNGQGGRLRLALAVGAALGLAACNADTTDVVVQSGDFILDFAIDATATGVPVGGLTIDAYEQDLPAALTLTVSNVAPLNGVYQVWLFNEETGQVTSPIGTVTVTEPGTDGEPVVVETAPGVRVFSGGAGRTFLFETDDQQAGVALGTFTHMFLSIESAEASSPAAAQPLWARYIDMAGDPNDDATLVFGTFGLGEPTPWSAGGFGRGGFLGDRIGDSESFRARFRNLPRPPVGYYMEGFFLDGDGNAASTGELTTPFEEGFASLREVDVDPDLSAFVRPDLITEAADQANQQDVGSPFYAFEEYIVALRPKLGADRGPTVMMTGLVPDAVKARRPK